MLCEYEIVLLDSEDSLDMKAEKCYRQFCASHHSFKWQFIVYLITSFSREWSSSDNASTKKTSVTRLACAEDQRREVWLEMGGRPKGENLSSTVETWQSTWLERGWCCSVSSMGSVHRQIQGRKGYSRPSKVEDEFQVCVECFAWYQRDTRKELSKGKRCFQNLQDDQAISR